MSFSPAAIVADEPTKGLDEIGSSHVAKALFGYNKQVIFATHDVDMITRPQYAIDRALVSTTTRWYSTGNLPPRPRSMRT